MLSLSSVLHSKSTNIIVFENLFIGNPREFMLKKTYDSITVCILVECNVLAAYSIYQVVSSLLLFGQCFCYVSNE